MAPSSEDICCISSNSNILFASPLLGKSEQCRRSSLSSRRLIWFHRNKCQLSPMSLSMALHLLGNTTLDPFTWDIITLWFTQRNWSKKGILSWNTQNGHCHPSPAHSSSEFPWLCFCINETWRNLSFSKM